MQRSMIFFFFYLKFQRPKINSPPKKLKKEFQNFCRHLNLQCYPFFSSYVPSKSILHSSPEYFFRSENIFTQVPMEKEWATWEKYIGSPNRLHQKLLHQAGILLVESHKKFGPSAPFENLTPQNDWKKYLGKEYKWLCGSKQARATTHKFSPKKIGWHKVVLPRKKLRAVKCDKSQSEIEFHFRCQKKQKFLRLALSSKLNLKQSASKKHPNVTKINLRDPKKIAIIPVNLDCD